MLQRIEAVRLVRKAEVEQLETVARIAPPQGEDELRLVVGFADRPRLAMVEGLPRHALRIGEPEPCAVESEYASRPSEADVLEGTTRDELRLKAALDLYFAVVEIGERRAAGRGAARLEVRATRVVSEDVVGAVGEDVREAAHAGIIRS